MSQEQPLPEHHQPAQASPQRPAGVATLARDLADFLVEFSIVLHKRAMYPYGHPHLQDSAERFVSRLESFIERRDALIIGVARHQLIIGGVATDPRNALLSDLARRLHKQRVASLRFQRGVALSEVDELLGALSSDPGGPEGPLGLHPQRSERWKHVAVQPPELGRLLLDRGGDAGGEERAAGASGELWVGLANLALSADGNIATDSDDPLVVARAIDDQAGQVAYDRVVLDYLSNMAEEISGRAGAWEPRARERVSRLVASLHPDTLRSLLQAGADHAERRRFALTASEVLAVDAVVEVVEAAAETTGQTISSHLLRMLHKFAHHAEQTSGPRRAEAESVLRTNVARLIANWELDDPNPTEYTAVLEGMVRHAAPERAVEPETTACEAENILQIALETGCLGPRVYAALERIVAERRFSRTAALLADAPSTEVADALWRHIATPARLRDELSAKTVDFLVVEGLAVRLGATAVDPLLDRLELAQDQSSRARLLRVLNRIGPAAAAPAIARLAQERAPWYVQRNILVLLHTLGTWPARFSPVPYARHPDHRVRREAIRILLSDPYHRGAAVARGLNDPDLGIVELVLRSTLESCPPEAARAVERFISAGGRPAELRALAVRVLAGAGTGEEQLLQRLMSLAAERRLLRGWRLAPKSAVVLAALSSLARYWNGHPDAAGLLSQARAHDDPEVQLAAQAQLG